MEYKFDKSFVMRITQKHVMSAIDLSIDKTYSRLGNIDDHTRREVWETLESLHQWKKMCQEFEEHNAHIFGVK